MSEAMKQLDEACDHIERALRLVVGVSLEAHLAERRAPGSEGATTREVVEDSIAASKEPGKWDDAPFTPSELEQHRQRLRLHREDNGDRCKVHCENYGCGTVARLIATVDAGWPEFLDGVELLLMECRDLLDRGNYGSEDRKWRGRAKERIARCLLAIDATKPTKPAPPSGPMQPLPKPTPPVVHPLAEESKAIDGDMRRIEDIIARHCNVGDVDEGVRQDFANAIRYERQRGDKAEAALDAERGRYDAMVAAFQMEIEGAKIAIREAKADRDALKAKLGEAERHEQQTHKALGEILGTDDALHVVAARMKARAEQAEAQLAAMTGETAVQAAHAELRKRGVGALMLPDTRAALTAAAEEGQQQMLRSIHSMLEQYPNGGGDLTVAKHIERIVKNRLAVKLQEKIIALRDEKISNRLLREQIVEVHKQLDEVCRDRDATHSKYLEARSQISLLCRDLTNAKATIDKLKI